MNAKINKPHMSLSSNRKILIPLIKLSVLQYGDQMWSHEIHFSVDLTEVFLNTVKLQWLEHLRDHGNMFETEVVRASEC